MNGVLLATRIMKGHEVVKNVQKQEIPLYY